MSASPDTLSSLAASASGMDGVQPSMDDVPVRPTPPSVSNGENEGDGEKKEGEGEGGGNWWDWLTHKADDVEAWVEDFIHKHVPGQKGGDGKSESE